MEISTRHCGRGVHLLAYLPDPTYPPLARALRRHPRRPQRPGAGDLRRLRALGIDITEDDVRRPGRRRRRDRPPARRRRDVALGVVARPRARRSTRCLNPGRPAYVDRYAAPLEEASRGRRGAGGRQRGRPPVGPRRRGACPTRRPSRASPASGWPASRSTTRTTRRRPRAAPRPGRATSTWWSPAPATTTARQGRPRPRAATPRRPSSSSGSSQRAGDAAAASGRTTARRPCRCPSPSRLLAPDRLEPLQHAGRHQPRGGRRSPCTARSGSRRPGPCRSRRGPWRPGRRRRAT